MQTKQARNIQRLQRVATFFAGRTIENPPPGLSDQVTALTTALAAAQDAAKVQADRTDYLSRQVRTIHQLRRTLHDDHLLPLYYSAAALRKEVPGIVEHFRIPLATLREPVYVTKLNTIVDRATEFQAHFLAHGAPADFVTTLSGAIAGYTTAAAARRQALQDRVAARKNVKVNLTVGSDAVRHLNAIVQRIYANDPGAKSAWTEAVRLGPSSRRTRAAAGGGSTTSSGSALSESNTSSSGTPTSTSTSTSSTSASSTSPTSGTASGTTSGGSLTIA